MPNRVFFDSRNEVLLFECPGCGELHAVRVKSRADGQVSGPVWGWNDSQERPTFSPSLLIRWTHGETHEPRCCHSFVRDGQIQFLGDCTHALANQTVDLPGVNEESSGIRL